MRRQGELKRSILFFVLFIGFLASVAGAQPQADSVILFIGDGMGANHIELVQRVSGKPALVMQKGAVTGTVDTRNAQGKITDSAAAATVLATGLKTNNGILGMSPDEKQLLTIVEQGLKLGKSAGIVTTDALTGATPAGFAAHVKSRGQAEEIADQFAKSKIQVLMGMGKGAFAPASRGGTRKDDKDLIAEMSRAGYEVVYNSKQLAAAKKPKLLGLFDDDAPTLTDMTRAAISHLAKNPKGFILIVEHAPIDWEPGYPAAIVQDMFKLNAAVAAALNFAKQRGRTLVVVTGDHETGGLMIKNPARVPILRKVKGSEEEIAAHLDAKRTNISEVMARYAGVTDLTPQEMASIDKSEDAASAISVLLNARAGLEWTSGGQHTDSPVRILAFGPGAKQFAGKMDNSDIPKRIAGILGMGTFPKYVENTRAENSLSKGQYYLAWAAN
jgi:alkaline phosphatase